MGGEQEIPLLPPSRYRATITHHMRIHYTHIDWNCKLEVLSQLYNLKETLLPLEHQYLEETRRGRPRRWYLPSIALRGEQPGLLNQVLIRER